MNEEAYNQKDFNPGGVPDIPDERDYRWNNEEFGAALPPFDWDKGFDIEEEIRTILSNADFKLKPNNQGDSQSCGGQAWSKYAAILYAVSAKLFNENSAKFIYSQTFIPGQGSRGRDNCEILIKQGCADENLCISYENGLPPSEFFMNKTQDITNEAKSNAKFDLALSYAIVAPNIDEFAHAIKNNYGMVIGVVGTWNNNSWRSENPEPPVGELNIWRHWIYAGKAKLINGKKKIGLLNSWGEQIGDHGWQWIGEDYFVENGKYLMGGWTHILATQKAPNKFRHNFLTNLKFGDKNDEVKILQQALQIDGVLPLTVQATGLYWTATCDAVRKFQSKYNLVIQDEIDKIQGKNVGPKTRTKLNELFNT